MTTLSGKHYYLSTMFYENFLNVNHNLKILVSQCFSNIYYIPLYILSFNFNNPSKFLLVDKLQNQFENFSEIQNIADKIKWLRHKKGLLQKDVADYLNIDRTSYVAYEKNSRGSYNINHLKKLAELFEIDITQLLDEYNMFLYKGQAKLLKYIRKELNVTQKDFAYMIDMTKHDVSNWEQSRTVLSKNTWKKIKKITDKNNIAF